VEGVGVIAGTIRKALVAASILLILPAASLAHLSNTGLGPYYDGLAHFWNSPEEFIPALALAFLAGLRGPRIGRYTLFILPGAWLAGGLLGIALPKMEHSTVLVCISFLLLGALVAADVRLRMAVVASLASVVGLLFGYLDGVGMSGAKLGELGLLGSVSSVFVLVALAAALVVSLHAPWARIVVRVAGSWIAAAGLLLIGWAVHSSNLNRSARSSTVSRQQFSDWHLRGERTGRNPG
jgi:urease accessory protein